MPDMLQGVNRAVWACCMPRTAGADAGKVEDLAQTSGVQLADALSRLACEAALPARCPEPLLSCLLHAEL